MKLETERDKYLLSLKFQQQNNLEDKIKDLVDENVKLNEKNKYLQI